MACYQFVCLCIEVLVGYRMIFLSDRGYVGLGYWGLHHSIYFLLLLGLTIVILHGILHTLFTYEFGDIQMKCVIKATFSPKSQGSV